MAANVNLRQRTLLTDFRLKSYLKTSIISLFLYSDRQVREYKYGLASGASAERTDATIFMKTTHPEFKYGKARIFNNGCPCCQSNSWHAIKRITNKARRRMFKCSLNKELAEISI